MALPTVAEVKTYLRIETDAEDALLANLILEAVGSIESVVGKSLTTEEVTWYDDAKTLSFTQPVTNLLLGYVPVDPDSVAVVDVDSDTFPSDEYVVRQDLSMLRGVGGSAFDNGPYVITATAGFGTSPNYETKWSPMIAALVIDYVAMLYQQRTPGASNENAAGASVTYAIDEATGLPARIARGIRKLRGIVA